MRSISSTGGSSSSNATCKPPPTTAPRPSSSRGFAACAGIDTLSAVGLVAEIGDFERFASADRFMSFVGLVPSERSSGEQRKLGSITKAGNDHARRLLVEAAWNHRRRPGASDTVQRRRRGQAALVVERAMRAEQRLHRRWSRMRSRGKDERTIVVAVARELAGFVWAVATEQPLAPIR